MASKIFNDSKKNNKSSVTMQYVVKLLRQVIQDIKSGECGESELVDALIRFNPETKGYIKDDMFLNYDEAGQFLGLGWNRNRLNDLCKLYGIKNHKFNNAHIGFSKREIEKLKEILDNKKSK